MGDWKAGASQITLTKRGALANRGRNGYWFVLPVAAILLLLVLYPLLYGFYISFFKTNLVKKWSFVGLKYYAEAFTSSDFLRQLWITIRFTAFVVAGHFFVGLLLSVLLNRQFPGRIVFRIILLLPWLFPESVIALLMKWIMNPIYGIFNHFMVSIGAIPAPVSWLGSASYAMTVSIFVCIWKGYPMVMMMLLAGLQSIPVDMMEAAKIDGANALQTFRYITLPSLRSVLTVTLVLDTVWWFKHYTLVYVLTNGGPGNETALVSIAIYKQAFDYFDFGRAAAYSVIVFSICLAMSIIYRRLLEHEKAAS